MHPPEMPLDIQMDKASEMPIAIALTGIWDDPLCLTIIITLLTNIKVHTPSTNMAFLKMEVTFMNSV